MQIINKLTPLVIFEDENLLVLDKPAGITVNRSDTTKGEITLQDWLEEQKKITIGGEDITSDFVMRSGIVHRLDKETSGILLVGKTREIFLALQAQFKERIVKKSYTALAHGKLVPVEGEIKAPVGRLPWSRMQFGVIAGGREATTFYKRIGLYLLEKRRETLSLVTLMPLTGRTHQIRVHLKYINHPIFADFLYAGRKVARDDRLLLARVFLHASAISFLHPGTKEQVSFVSELPKELAAFLQTMQKLE